MTEKRSFEGLPLTGMLFCYRTKKEMDEIYKRLTDLKLPESKVLKAWNQTRPPYAWTVAIVCKGREQLDEIDDIISKRDFDLGDADCYSGEIRIQQFFGMMVIGKYEPGMVRIEAGECPRGAKTLIACTLCPVGHMLECHYNMTCEKAQCSHLVKYDEDEDAIYKDES